MKKLLFILAITSSISCFAQEKQVQDAMEKKYGEPGTEKMNEWLAGMNGQVEPEYSFPMSVEMTMTSYKNGKPSKPMQMTVYINNDKGIFATKMSDTKGKGDMMMVIDQNTSNMVMINEKDKTAMAINMGAFMNSEKAKKMKEESGADGVDCKKTGSIKTVAGYTCEGFVCTNPERQGRYEIFVTNKVRFDFGKGGKNNPFADYFNKASGLGGMMMEGNFYEKDELQTTVIVNNVNTSANYKINTAGYKTGLH